MINEVENIQNRVRNKLGSLQSLIDLSEIILEQDYNSKLYNQAINLLSNNIKYANQSIKDLIDIARECDKKINNKKFDVWEEVLKSRKNNE